MSERISGWLRALAIALVLMAICAPALADSIEVKLNASATVYSSLTSSAKKVKAPKGLQVSLRACSKGWARIVYKGKTGYIKLKYLDRVVPLKAYIGKDATVYRSASASRTLTTLSQGTQVYALGAEGGYVRIMNEDKSWKGYIRAGVLSSARPDAAKGASMPEQLQATAEGARASKIEKTIYVAQALVGTPCSDDPNPPRSFDCAGYTVYSGVLQYGRRQGSVRSCGHLPGEGILPARLPGGEKGHCQPAQKRLLQPRVQLGPEDFLIDAEQKESGAQFRLESSPRFIVRFPP